MQKRHGGERVSNRAISIRIPEHIRADIEETARRSRRDFSSVANEMLDEAVRMRRVPGITFADEPTGRVARVGGSGLGVWEIIQAYRDENGNWDHLREGFHWLSENQLRAALAYAEAYPDEIEERLAREDELTIERIWELYPYTKPRTPGPLLSDHA
jgi:uncharacterized protein (DUF433 family)